MPFVYKVIYWERVQKWARENVVIVLFKCLDKFYKHIVTASATKIFKKSWARPLIIIDVQLNNSKNLIMDKLYLTGQNLGRVYKFRRGCVYVVYSFFIWAKQPNLKLKTRPKQLLGYLPLDIALPDHIDNSNCCFNKHFFSSSSVY
jgi:hypothetical protein